MPDGKDYSRAVRGLTLVSFPHRLKGAANQFALPTGKMRIMLVIKAERDKVEWMNETKILRSARKSPEELVLAHNIGLLDHAGGVHVDVGLLEVVVKKIMQQDS